MQEKIRVLNVYKTYFPDPPGGLQEAIRQICLSTKKYNIDNTIFTLSKKPSPKLIKFNEADVIREKSYIAPASCDIGGLSAVQSIKKAASNAELVHYFHPWPFADILNKGIDSKKPCVLTYISDVVRQRFLGKLYSPIMWSHLDSANVIIANCPAYVDSSPILSNSRIRHKVKVIPLGIDEMSYPQSSDDEIFSKLKLDKNSPYFLFLGVLRYYKGLDFLIRAVRNIEVPVVIAGSGPEEKKLKQMTLDLGLNNIIFAGQVSDKEKVSLIKNTYSLILPSHLRSEAYGMVLVEASMFSKPMISCEIGTGTSFINQHNETGLVIPPRNSQALTEAMQWFLNNPDLQNEMGRKARQRYEQNFSSKALGLAYAEVYKSLL